MRLITCDQCNIATINGVVCHEIGCENSRKKWDSDSEQWVRTYKCRICGFDAPESGCDCQDEPEF